MVHVAVGAEIIDRLQQELKWFRNPEERRGLKVQSVHTGPAALRQGDAKLPVGADVELGEHLIHLADERYARLVIEVDDRWATATSIDQALARRVGQEH